MMSDKKVLVYIELNNENRFVGTLWSHFNRGKETSDFEYSKEWLNNPKSFSLEPGLFFGSGKQVNPRQTPLFGSFGDSAPDTWAEFLCEDMKTKKQKKKTEALELSMKLTIFYM